MAEFGNIKFDPQYPVANWGGFTIEVDMLASKGSDAAALGGGWQSMVMGDVTLKTDVVTPGGMSQARVQLLGVLGYGDVTISRGWNAGSTNWIPQWINLAEQFGPTTVAIKIVGKDKNGISQTWVLSLRNCLPKVWLPPTFAVTANATPGSGNATGWAEEKLVFSYGGFLQNTLSSDQSSLAVGSQVYLDEKATECRLILLPGGGAHAGVASALASLTSWTPSLTAFGVGNSAMSAGVASMVSGFPSVTFLVPPASIKISKGSDWKLDTSPSATGSGPVQWQGTQPMSMSFDFILDTDPADTNAMQNSKTGDPGDSAGSPGSVLPDVEKLLSLCEVDPIGGLLGIGTSPLAMLIWGQFVSPVSLVKSIDVEFSSFNADGTPTRAEGKMTLQQYPVPEGAQNPTSGGDVARRSAKIYEGDTLAHVAYREYRSPSRWRDLAESNRIDDPLRVRPGALLVVPAPEQLPRRGHGGSAQRTSRGRQT
jgi:hypothetical protein